MKMWEDDGASKPWNYFNIKHYFCLKHFYDAYIEKQQHSTYIKEQLPAVK